MLSAAVVPEGHRMGLPAEAHLELRTGQVLVEKGQDSFAFLPRYVIDMGSEIGIDEQPLAAGLRVGAHNRMTGTRVMAAGVVDTLVAVATAVDMLTIVCRRQALQVLLQPWRECGKRGFGIAEQGVSPPGRYLMQMQNAAHGWLRVAGHVGVPAIAGDAYGTRIGLDRQQFRKALGTAHVGVLVQRAEVQAEAPVLFQRQRLVAEENHLMLKQCPADLSYLLGVQRTGDVQAVDFSADDCGQWNDLDMTVHGTHGPFTQRWKENGAGRRGGSTAAGRLGCRHGASRAGCPVCRRSCTGHGVAGPESPARRSPDDSGG